MNSSNNNENMNSSLVNLNINEHHLHYQYDKNQDSNFDQSLKTESLPDYLFLDEKSLTNNKDSDYKIIKKSLNEDVKFNCSTPIKFYLNNEEETKLDDSSSEKTDSNDSETSININDEINSEKLNKSEENENVSEIKLIESLKAKELDLVNVSLKLKIQQNEKEEQKDYSLLEFEENEKLAANCSIFSSTETNTSIIKGPINQMESLLNNLRSNYNYKNSTTKNSVELLEIKNKQNNNESINDYSIVIGMDQLLQDKQTLVKSKILSPKMINLEEKTEENLQQSFIKKNEKLVKIESQLESEIFRRKHCEKQICDLNQSILELQQQLAVANGLEKKHELFAQNMDISIQKVLENWKIKELEIEKSIKNLKKDQQKMTENETKLNMRAQFLEQEFKKVTNDLIVEKVKSLEYQNEIKSLKNELNNLEKSNVEKTNKFDQYEKEIAKFKEIENYLNDNLNETKKELDDIKKESTKKERDLLIQIERLSIEKKCFYEQNEKLKQDYDNLIKEAKLVVDESENQYKQLLKNIEIEKLAKDSLQVEINVLEEKLENTVKRLTNEYENKLSLLQTSSLEKEKLLIETQKVEMEKLHSKTKSEFEKLKMMHFQEIQTQTDEYEMKLTDLNLKLDSHRNEIERLKRSNTDLENERNTIRQNLKQMLELQMKETMQILGINSNDNKTSSNLNNNNILPSNDYNENSSMKSKLLLLSDLNNMHIENNFENSKSDLIIPPTKEKDTFTSLLVQNLSSISDLNSLNINIFNSNNNKINSATPKIKTSSPNEINHISTRIESNTTNINTKKYPFHTASSSIADLVSTINNSSSIQPASSKLNNSFSSSFMPSQNKNLNSNYSTSLNKLNSSLNFLNESSLNNDENKKSNDKNNAISVEIKDEFILNQIDLINKYYQIDNKTLAVAAAVNSSNLNLEKSNLSLNHSATNNFNNVGDKKYLKNSSFELEKPNAEKVDLEDLNNYPESMVESIKTFKVKKSNYDIQNISKLGAKSMSNIFDVAEKSKILEQLDKNHFALDKKEENLRIRSYSSNERNQDTKLNNLTSTTPNVNSINENNQNESRSQELRHYIELLLNRSPSSNVSESNDQDHSFQNVTDRFDGTANNNCHKLEEINKIEKNRDESMSESNNIKYSEEKTDKDKSGFNTDSEDGKKYSYDSHDLSDLELGYTKRQSCEYYDDVKRNLKFDDDDEEEEEEKFDFTPFKNEDNDKIVNSTPNEKIIINDKSKSNTKEIKNKTQDLKKIEVKNSEKKVNINKSLNSSISTIHSLNSTCKGFKGLFQPKSARKISQQDKSNSIQSHNRTNSMNALSSPKSILSNNQNQYQSTQKINNIKDSSNFSKANLKSASTISTSGASNKRVWK